MPIISDIQLKEHIKTNSLSRVYLLCGNEGYLKSKYLNQLVKTALDNEDSNFAYSVFETQNYNTDIFYDFISMLPFGVNKKCAVISDVDFGEKFSSDVNKLIEALSDIPDFSTVIFYYNAIDPEKSKTSFKALLDFIKDAGDIVRFDKKTERDIIPFLTKLAANNGSKINSHTARYLVDCCGDDLQTLINETEKLCFYCTGQEITPSDIDLLCVKTLESNVFSMTDAIVTGNTDKALAVLNDLFFAKTASEQILGAMSASFVNMYKARVSMNCDLTREEFSKNACITSLELYNFQKNAKNFTMPRIRKCLKILESADYTMKSTYLSENKKRILIEETVVKLVKSAVL